MLIARAAADIENTFISSCPVNVTLVVETLSGSTSAPSTCHSAIALGVATGTAMFAGILNHRASCSMPPSFAARLKISSNIPVGMTAEFELVDMKLLSRFSVISVCLACSIAEDSSPESG